jgi:hypothetical protein
MPRGACSAHGADVVRAKRDPLELLLGVTASTAGGVMAGGSASIRHSLRVVALLLPLLTSAAIEAAALRGEAGPEDQDESDDVELAGEHAVEVPEAEWERCPSCAKLRGRQASSLPRFGSAHVRRLGMAGGSASICLSLRARAYLPSWGASDEAEEHEDPTIGDKEDPEDEEHGDEHEVEAQGAEWGGRSPCALPRGSRTASPPFSVAAAAPCLPLTLTEGSASCRHSRHGYSCLRMPVETRAESALESSEDPGDGRRTCAMPRGSRTASLPRFAPAGAHRGTARVAASRSGGALAGGSASIRQSPLSLAYLISVVVSGAAEDLEEPAFRAGERPSRDGHEWVAQGAEWEGRSPCA